MNRWNLEGRDEKLFDAGRRCQELDSAQDDMYALEQEITSHPELAFLERLRKVVALLLHREIANASELSIDEAQSPMDKDLEAAQTISGSASSGVSASPPEEE